MLDLKTDAGADALLRLVDRADVLIENFRPGTLERLGFGPDVLFARNPGLVLLRVTGFGQDGPYANRPGFATMAEAMSGFAAINGEPDGPPLLPPIALTDEVAALAGAFAVMVALRDRDRSGEGQVIDVNLLESMVQMMSALPSAAAHLDYDQPRLGSGIPYSVPRGTYRCADNEWVAISTSAEIGRAPRARRCSASATTRASRRSRAGPSTATSSTPRSRSGSAPARERGARRVRSREAAIAPVYTMRELLHDPHVQARNVFPEVDGIVMQGPTARLSRTPAELRWAGRALGADTDEVLATLRRRIAALERRKKLAQVASGASSTRSRPRARASSRARLAWCTSSAAPNAWVG